MFDLWKLCDYEPGQGVAAGAHQPGFDDKQWIDIPVPGDVHQALLAAGRIEDPFYDQNEPKCAWIEEREWWYRLTFDGPARPSLADERLLLAFQGVDTFATFWLNGEELGKHANMFTEAIFDVTKKIKPGQPNTLAICFDRPLDHVPADPNFKPWGHSPERVWMRKAQFGYGWDWGPRLPTVGLWRSVELRKQKTAAIKGLHFQTLKIDPKEDVALVQVSVQIDRFATQKALDLHIRLAPPTGSNQALVETTMTVDHTEATAYLTVMHPALWWTHDLGKPELTDLGVELFLDDKVIDRMNEIVGIRTIELDQSVDVEEPGTRFFRFVLNGVPIFARGADWIPADSFVGGIPDERYENLLKMARDANMNMLRVWGGGVYEHDIFYDLCDRLGILLWQDFMFACAAYPDHSTEYAKEVEAEAIYQVLRLRNHPSMGVWCGNNENQWIHDQIFWSTPESKVPGALFYDVIIPRVVAELDGSVPYWPSSPYGGNDYNSADDGDRHNWHVWHGGSPRRFGEEPINTNTPEGVSYMRYAEDMGRFISEFGMHAAPVFETLARVIPEDQRYHHSPSMDHHNKDNPKNKGDNLMLATTGLPKDLEEYIDFSMIAQAEGLKFGIEHYRRRKPHCSGALFWQLNDCWPVLSWAVVDYYGFGKAGYYYSCRVFAPVLASFKDAADGAVELWLTNDTLQDQSDTFTVRQGSFAGAVDWEETFEASVPANGSVCVRRWEAGKLVKDGSHYLSSRALSGLAPANRHFFTAIKDLKIEKTALKYKVTATDEDTLAVSFEAPTYARFVHAFYPDEQARYSDNYFDLQPGETRQIKIRVSGETMDPEKLVIRWL